MYLNEERARREMVTIGKMMHQKEFVDGSSGNISARVGSERILVTPSGLMKGFLKPEQMIAVNMEGQVTEDQSSAARELKPTSELPMHLECYRQRPDVNGVVHAHPIYSVALSIAGVPMSECVIPEAVIILGTVPTTPYANPSSEENRQAILRVVGSHDAILLQYHGSLTVAKDVWGAYSKLETLEHSARIIAIARMLGEANPLTKDQVVKLIETRNKVGYARPEDEQDFCDHCGVCHDSDQHTDLNALVRSVKKDVMDVLRS